MSVLTSSQQGALRVLRHACLGAGPEVLLALVRSIMKNYALPILDIEVQGATIEEQAVGVHNNVTNLIAGLYRSWGIQADLALRLARKGVLPTKLIGMTESDIVALGQFGPASARKIHEAVEATRGRLLIEDTSS